MHATASYYGVDFRAILSEQRSTLKARSRKLPSCNFKTTMTIGVKAEEMIKQQCISWQIAARTPNKAGRLLQHRFENFIGKATYEDLCMQQYALNQHTSGIQSDTITGRTSCRRPHFAGKAYRLSCRRWSWESCSPGPRHVSRRIERRLHCELFAVKGGINPVTRTRL